MIFVAITTKMYKGFQTIVPSEVRNKLNVENTDILDWKINLNDHTVIISFRKKPNLHDLSGMGEITKETNAVDLKHKSQRGSL